MTGTQPATYRVGAPDPSPYDPSVTHCAARDPDRGYVCTWWPGHGGDHVAGNGAYILATWPQAAPPAPHPLVGRTITGYHDWDFAARALHTGDLVMWTETVLTLDDGTTRTFGGPGDTELVYASITLRSECTTGDDGALHLPYDELD